MTECSRCVMRSADDPDLVLVDGVCNHCRRYDDLLTSRVVTGEEGATELNQIAGGIKGSGRKEFDCVIGVSGGVDSTYVALKAVELGLRPLAVHVDNGWNSEVAVQNIEKTLNALDIELHTVVLDLREFYDLQRSFLFASTPDGEIPTDHAIQATLWKTARQNGIRTIISGMNFRTEAISVPSWSYGHSDWRYIRGVQRRHGTRSLATYPHFGFGELGYVTAVRRIRVLSILNYLDYDKAAAVDELQAKLNWTPYGGKHYESIYTRWYQGHVLPQKFGIDKRRGHYSDLINSGQICRSDALLGLAQPDYDDDLRDRDQQFVLKKLSLSSAQFDEIMAAPVRSFRDYPNSYETVQRLRGLANGLRHRGWYPK
ncbi:N-acetyl sugar amidotransferase [Nocardioides dubius]|uniref:N-acetyl sugar amidotransferase n=1 Tax=Nocardioides dubius TaxID=317019 RepID=A0ABN1TYJ9_9ACTN